MVITNSSEKDPTNYILVQVAQDCTGMNVSYEDWKSGVLPLLSEDTQLKQIQAASIDYTISKYNQKTVKTSSGDVIFTDMYIDYQGKPANRCCVYDIYANEVWVEVVYYNFDNKTDKTLEAAVDMLMDTLKVSK